MIDISTYDVKKLRGMSKVARKELKTLGVIRDYVEYKLISYEDALSQINTELKKSKHVKVKKVSTIH